MRLLFAMSCVVVALALVVGDGATSAAQKEGEPKFTIKEVMVKAHKGKDALLNKVKGGTATQAEAKDLLEMYVALSKNKPPKGDADDWKKKTDALVAAEKLVVDGKKDEGIKALTDAANCAACHKLHKG